MDEMHHDLFDSMAGHFSVVGELMPARILNAPCCVETCGHGLIRVTGLAQTDVSPPSWVDASGGCGPQRRKDIRIFYGVCQTMHGTDVPHGVPTDFGSRCTRTLSMGWRRSADHGAIPPSRQCVLG